jgi:hypothetical protein
MELDGDNYCWDGAFAVIDIVGSIPIIVDLRSKFGHIESEKLL